MSSLFQERFTWSFLNTTFVCLVLDAFSKKSNLSNFHYDVLARLCACLSVRSSVCLSVCFFYSCSEFMKPTVVHDVWGVKLYPSVPLVLPYHNVTVWVVQGIIYSCSCLFSNAILGNLTSALITHSWNRTIFNISSRNISKQNQMNAHNISWLNLEEVTVIHTVCNLPM